MSVLLQLSALMPCLSKCVFVCVLVCICVCAGVCVCTRRTVKCGHAAVLSVDTELFLKGVNRLEDTPAATVGQNMESK